MKTLSIARSAAVLLAVALGSGAALAQSSPRVVTDAAPLPAEDRSSMGAVVLEDSPVLAQARMMQTLAGNRPDTSTMGAPAERVIEKARREEERKLRRDKVQPLR